VELPRLDEFTSFRLMNWPELSGGARVPIWTGVGGTKDNRLEGFARLAWGDEACSVIMGIIVFCRGVVAPGVVGRTVS
jgi:hypothetical protein